MTMQEKVEGVYIFFQMLKDSIKEGNDEKTRTTLGIIDECLVEILDEMEMEGNKQ